MSNKKPLYVLWLVCKCVFDWMINERKGKERKGKERKGKERKGKERKGKERKGKLSHIRNTVAKSLVTGLIDQCRIGAVIPSEADEP